MISNFSRKIMKFAKISGFIIAFLAFITINSVNAERMTSSNFKVESDSINFGGGRSLSGSYTIEDTAGEVGTGYSTSTNFKIHAGYQQNNTVNLFVTPASNVTMSPSIPGLTGGTANGQTTLTVTTDNPAGYMTTISAEGEPALQNSYGSFADYIPAGANPDYGFTNASTNSSFAFTVESSDLAQRFKNSGASCGIGSSDDVDACWDGLATTSKTIILRNSNNNPGGTVSTLKFRAESGSGHVQPDGIYNATTTITVISL